MKRIEFPRKMRLQFVKMFSALLVVSGCQAETGGAEPIADSSPSSTGLPVMNTSSSMSSAVPQVTNTASVIPSQPIAEDTVTWHGQVAPLVLEKCGGCHVSGGIAPFSLQSYEEAKLWATLMAESVAAGTMPPWGAEETDECTPPARFKDDVRLSPEQKQTFQRWIDEGLAEGAPEDAAPIVPPPARELSAPTRQLTIPSPVTVDGVSDKFVCFTLDPDVTDDVWLTGTHVVAGNSAIVHHALVFLDRDGQGQQLADENGQYPCFGSAGLDNTALVAAWAPGGAPAVLPERMGMPLKPGDKLVVQVHYHPTGQGAEIDDATRVDLAWGTAEPEYIARIYLIGNFDEVNPAWAGGDGYGLTTGPDFLIPAGATNHQEVNRYRIDDGGNALARLLPVYVWMVSTHMHYVGRDMKITASAPSGESQCLIQTPRWDFNWQRGYLYQGEVEELPTLHLGDSLEMRCTYDNSMGNPFVSDALAAQGLRVPQDVRLGEGTLDEMCLGVFGLAVSKDFAKDLGF